MDTPDIPVEHAAFVHQDAPPLVEQLNAGDAEPARPAPPPAPPSPSASAATQIGGDHYTKRKIQPLTYAMKNELGFVEGTVCKYVTRWRDKGGIQDLEKALDILMKYVAHLHDEAAEALRSSPAAGSRNPA